MELDVTKYFWCYQKNLNQIFKLY